MTAEDMAYTAKARLDQLVSSGGLGGSGWPTQYFEKSANETRQSTTTLSPDGNTGGTTQILVTAGRTYLFIANLIYFGAATNGGFRFAWLGPSGTPMRYSLTYLKGTTTPSVDEPGTDGAVFDAITDGTSNNHMVRMSGIVQPGSSSGAMVLNWCQSISSSTQTRLAAGTHVAAWQVA